MMALMTTISFIRHQFLDTGTLARSVSAARRRAPPASMTVAKVIYEGLAAR